MRTKWDNVCEWSSQHYETQFMLALLLLLNSYVPHIVLGVSHFLFFFNTHKHLVRTISFIVLPNSSFACKPKRLTLDNKHTYKKCRNQDDTSDQHSRYTMLPLLVWIKSNHFFILLSLCSRETSVSYTWIFNHNLPKEGIDTLVNIPIKINHNGEQVIL